jgi:hypothetical protein
MIDILVLVYEPAPNRNLRLRNEMLDLGVECSTIAGRTRRESDSLCSDKVAEWGKDGIAKR